MAVKVASSRLPSRRGNALRNASSWGLVSAWDTFCWLAIFRAPEQTEMSEARRPAARLGLDAGQSFEVTDVGEGDVVARRISTGIAAAEHERRDQAGRGPDHALRRGRADEDPTRGQTQSELFHQLLVATVNDRGVPTAFELEQLPAKLDPGRFI